MPDFTISLTLKQVGRLNVHVARYNADNKAALTLAAWLELHVRELAIQEELAAEHARLTAQAEQDVRAALIVAREQLLSGPPAVEGGAA